MPRKKPKRCVCHVCKRRRLAKFMEWHPGIEEWQCKDFDECDAAKEATMTKPKLSFCESATAAGYGKWHLRKLTDEGQKLSGGIDTPSLCYHVQQGWDIDVKLTEHHLRHNTCLTCLAQAKHLELL